MIGKAIIAAMALGAIALPASVAAQSAEYRAIEEKSLANGKQKLDPAKAYIFVHFPNRWNGLFIKQPNSEELAEYEAEWRTKLAKEIKDFPKDHARWVRDKEFNELRYDPKKSVRPEPVMPTEENFSIGEIERRLLVSFGPQYIFNKGEDYFSYLIEVEPGTYTFYGPVLAAPNGAMAGICYCMGSVKFDADAGAVTNLGDFLALRWMNREQADAVSFLPVEEVKPQAVDYALPASLSAFPSRQVDLRAAGKMNNFFGIRIGRMPPVPGVLEYQRDTVIDVKGRAAAEAPEN